MRRQLRAIAFGIIFLFVASFLSQSALPLIHFRDVDARETRTQAGKHHSASQVTQAPGSFHHHSTTCPVCQILHSTQPTEVQSTDSLILLTQAITLLSTEVESLDPRGPALTGWSPRAPPQAS